MSLEAEKTWLQVESERWGLKFNLAGEASIPFRKKSLSAFDPVFAFYCQFMPAILCFFILNPREAPLDQDHVFLFA